MKQRIEHMRQVWLAEVRKREEQKAEADHMIVYMKGASDAAMEILRLFEDKEQTGPHATDKSVAPSAEEVGHGDE